MLFNDTCIIVRNVNYTHMRSRTEEAKFTGSSESFPKTSLLGKKEERLGLNQTKGRHKKKKKKGKLEG